MKAYTSISTRTTPQNEKIPGQEDRQVENSAGGVSYAVDDFTRLHRFLILGSEGGSYYASEQSLTKDNANSVLNCIKQDGPRTVQVIVEISKDGRAPKNDPAIFALAMCAGLGDDATRRAALDALPDVCRIGTHLFHFATYVEQFRGWGRGLRKAVARWYNDKPLDKLAYDLVKYRQRDGWSHDDLLRLSHPEPADVERDAVYKYVTQPEGFSLETFLPALPSAIQGFEAAQKAATPQETAALVTKYGLPRETLKTDHLTDPAVWDAMVQAGMPMTAMIRNLATMTRIGLLTPTSDATMKVREQILNGDAIRKARVHPVQILMAARTYAAGYSLRGSNRWAPLPTLVDALDEAFYMAFDNVQATGKRRLIALDISGSMWMGEVAGIPGFTPAEAAGAMALVSMKTGDPYEVVAFTSSGYGYRSYGRSGDHRTPTEIIPGLSVHAFSARQRLDDVCKQMQELSRYMGGTDCSLPMVYASEKGRQFDIFEIYTDSETWAGGIHPSQALVQYRKDSGINAKLVVVGMVSNGFSIADPNDPGMLDVVGFDTATPNLIAAFAEGGF